MASLAEQMSAWYTSYRFFEDTVAKITRKI